MGIIEILGELEESAYFPYCTSLEICIYFWLSQYHSFNDKILSQEIVSV